MSLVTTAQVLAYVADCAKYMMEMDTNEAGSWSDEEFTELQTRAFALTRRLKSDEGE